mmetsp:Transcript_10832/g.27886  ORF Transcript_10832/g.27886 Transcript_10832/m.27886 type:complete len:255 (+) Transcript_10832:211-975(+)
MDVRGCDTTVILEVDEARGKLDVDLVLFEVASGHRQRLHCFEDRLISLGEHPYPLAVSKSARNGASHLVRVRCALHKEVLRVHLVGDGLDPRHLKRAPHRAAVKGGLHQNVHRLVLVGSEVGSGNRNCLDRLVDGRGTAGQGGGGATSHANDVLDGPRALLHVGLLAHLERSLVLVGSRNVIERGARNVLVPGEGAGCPASCRSTRRATSFAGPKTSRSCRAGPGPASTGRATPLLWLPRGLDNLVKRHIWVHG